MTTNRGEQYTGGESGTPYPDAAIARKPPKNKDSYKAGSGFVTTGVYH